MKTIHSLFITGLGLVVPALSLAQPVITTQPLDQTNAAGAAATFSVAVTGTPPLAFQWQRDTGVLDFTDFADHTNSTLVLLNVGTNDAVNYRVIITNVEGSVTSATAHLYVILPPQIIWVTNYGPPFVHAGATVRLRVNASGMAPLAFQWLLNGAGVAAATNYSLVLANVQTNNAGLYTVVVTNYAGSVTSAPLSLAVDPSPGYAALYIFGSSWADTQNGPYWNGHWSNGPMWPEFLSAKLGLPYTAANNFAVGGSRVEDVLAQVSNFTPPAHAATSLFHFWGGYTDFYDTDSLTNDAIWNTRIQTRTATLSNAVIRLYAKGARAIVVPNVFDRAHDPEFIALWQNDPASQTKYSALIDHFNSAWAAALAAIDNAKPDLQLFIVDFHSKFDDVVKRFADYGFSKATPDALDDPALSDQSYTGPGADYLYWNPHHATSKAHAIFADWYFEAVSNSILERLELDTLASSLDLRMNKLRVGRTYTLQNSTNLVDWQELQTFTAVAGTNLLPITLTGLNTSFFRLTWRR
jgi:phospholipase/lecithinase/hemolysin